MNYSLHILSKDLRRFWPMIALAFAVHLFGYCVALSNLDEASYFSGFGPTLAKAFQQAPLIRWIMVFLLSAWVVLEDRAVGDRIAWRTRPIFVRDILTAKFCFLVVGIAAPAGLAGIVVSLWLKAPLATVLATGVSNFFFTLCGTAICAAIAVVSATMNQALLWLAGAFGAVMLTTYVIFQLGHVRLPPSPVSVSHVTSFMIVIAMANIGAMAALSHQYLTHRVWRTVLLVAVFVPLICLTDHYWPVDFWPEKVFQTSLAPTAPEQLKLAPADSAADFRTSQQAFEREATIQIPLHLEGRPWDRAFVVNSVTSQLVTDNGQTFSTFSPGGGNIFETPFTALSLLGATHRDGAPLRYVPAVMLPAETFERLQGHSGRLTAEVKLSEKHYGVIAHLPVKAGAEKIEDGHLIRIRSVQLEDSRCGVGFQFDHVNPALGTQQFFWPNRCVLVNAKRKEYSIAHGGRISSTGGADMFFVTAYNFFDVTQNLETSAEVGKVDAEWLKDAEFFFLAANDVRSAPITLPFTVQKLIIPTTQIIHHIIIINPDGTRTEYEK